MRACAESRDSERVGLPRVARASRQSFSGKELPPSMRQTARRRRFKDGRFASAMNPRQGFPNTSATPKTRARTDALVGAPWGHRALQKRPSLDRARPLPFSEHYWRPDCRVSRLAEHTGASGGVHMQADVRCATQDASHSRREARATRGTPSGCSDSSDWF